MLAAVGEGYVECGGGGVGVIEKHFEEIAHAEEQQGVGVALLQREPLRHGGRGAGGGAGWGGVGHGASIGGDAGLCTRPQVIK